MGFHPQHHDPNNPHSIGTLQGQRHDFAYSDRVNREAALSSPAPTPSPSVPYTIYPPGPGPSLGVILVALGAIGFVFIYAPYYVADKMGHWIWGALTFASFAAVSVAGWMFFQTNLGRLVASILFQTVILGGLGWFAWLGATNTSPSLEALVPLLAALGATVTLLHRVFYWPIGSEEEVWRASQRADQAQRIAKIVTLSILGLGALVLLSQAFK